MNKKLEEMTGTELLARYNELSPTKRRAKFDSKEEAITRIRTLKPLVEEVKAGEAKPKVKAREADGVVYAKTPTKVRGGQCVLRIMVDRNPRREGTEAHKHFEKMLGGITVEQYLAKFELEDRRTARQWLSNTIRDGFVELIVQ